MSKEKGILGFAGDDLSMVLDISNEIRSALESYGAGLIGAGCGFGGRDMEFEYRGKTIEVTIIVREGEDK